MGYLDVFLTEVLEQTSEYPFCSFIFFEITKKDTCLWLLHSAKEAYQIWFHTRGIFAHEDYEWGRHQGDTVIFRGKSWCTRSCITRHPCSLITSLLTSTFYINSLSNLYFPALDLGGFFFHFDKVSIRYFILTTLLSTQAALTVWHLFTVSTIRE